MARVGAVEIATSGRVVRATIDRPEVRNAINDAVLDGLEAAVATAESQASVLVLSGSGGNFCAGADLSQVKGMVEDRPALERFVTRLSDILDRIEAGPFASVCVVDGYALAGGCEILLACDVVIASEDARIGDRHLEFGLLPGAGGSVRLVRSLAATRARYLLLTGETVSGRQAADWGLVTTAVPPASLEAAVAADVDRLATRSPDALRAAKAMALDARDLPHRDALLAERKRFLDHVTSSPDTTEGLAAFQHKRPPVWNQEHT